MPRRHAFRSLFLAFLLLGPLATILTPTAAGQESASKPAAPAATTLPPLANDIPAENLVFFTEVTGLNAHAEAWDKTATSKILSKTQTGAMIDELLPQLFDQSLAALPIAKPSGEDLTAILKHAVRNGAVAAFHKPPGNPASAGVTVVFRGAFHPEIRPAFARLLKAITPEKPTKVAKPGDRSLVVIPNPASKSGLYWWIEKKEDLVFASDPDQVIQAIDGKCPRAADLPIRKELAQADGGFEPVAFAFADKALLASLPPAQTAGLGLGSIERIDWRWGTQGEALMTVLRASAPGTRSGMLALFDQPTFTTKALPALPSGVRNLGVLSVDLTKAYDALRAQLKEKNSSADEKLADFERAVKEKTRLRLREDILGELGPKITVFEKPKRSKSPTSEPAKDDATKKAESAEPKAEATAGSKLLGAMTALSGLSVDVPKTAVLIETKNPKTFAKRLDEMIVAANRELRSVPLPGAQPADAKPSGETRARKGGRAGKGLEFQATGQQPKIYVLSVPPAFAALTSLKLTVAMGKSHLIVGTAPDVVKDALSAESKPAPKKPPEELSKALEHAPPDLIFLAVKDQRDNLPEALANFPKALQTYLANMQAQSMARMHAAQPTAAPAAAAPVPEFKVDPAHIPKADELREYLFPMSLAVSVDAKGIRLVSRSAFPDFAGSLAEQNRMTPFWKWLTTSLGLAPAAAAPAGAGASGAPAGNSAAPR